MRKADTKDQLHPRSRFRSRYDFARLVAAHAVLAGFVKTNAHGDAGINYADPRAVKALNAALLADAYGLRGWDLPAGHLCPTAPIETLKPCKLWITVGTKRGLSERFLQMSERRKQAFMRFFEFSSDCFDRKKRG